MAVETSAAAVLVNLFFQDMLVSGQYKATALCYFLCSFLRL
jgi:hypothetical protein